MYSRSLKLTGVAALCLICLIGLTGCESPNNHAISVLRTTSGSNNARLDAIRQLQAGGKEAVLKAKPELIKALDNSAPDIQRAAQEALTLVGTDVASDLVRVSEDTQRRAGALRILGQTAVSDAVVRQVISNSGSGSFASRLHATELLGALAVKSDSALTQLGHLASDQDPQIRVAAIEEAIDLPSKRGVPLVSALITALGDPVPAVREAACIGLGNLGPTAIQARSALEQLRGGRDPELAQSARIALSAVDPSAPDQREPR